MIQPASLAWFARHELALFWRDWLSLMTAGKRAREPLVALVVIVIAVLAHGLAYAMVGSAARAGIGPDQATLALVTGMVFLSWTVMLSQAIESVTRAFYARADLDLILSSPASAARVFAIRIGAIALSTTLLAMALAGPVINVLALADHPAWLAAYGLIAAMGAAATGGAVLATVTLFRVVGPKRTRLIAQIVAAVIGAAFVIGIQAAAILGLGSFSRLTLLQAEGFVALTPAATSVIWWPARAAMGDPVALALVVGLAGAFLAAVTAACAARFGDHVLAASGVAEGTVRQRRGTGRFGRGTPRQALRRKEWTLLRRDPWLVSQSLMQLLYLLPPALFLWRSFGDHVGALLVIVPVVVMAAGQLAGGLAWLAVSGEDAPDLVASAPLAPRVVILAKIEAVLLAIALVVAPLVVALAFASPWLAGVAALGVALAAASATMIQIWFRAQAKRSSFRRRQTSSRVATLTEALSSILWAGTAGLAAAGSWFAVAAAALTLVILTCGWWIRPQPTDF